MKIAVIGGGAAGFFAAINVKLNFAEAEVCLLEKTNKTLSKVKISGGGRCNVTNGSSSIKELSEAYPRGSKKMKSLLKVFSTPDTQDWFTSRGVPLYTQDDNRVFPTSNKSDSIIDCFMDEVQKLNINLRLKEGVTSLKKNEDKIDLEISGEKTETFDKVIVATGGSPKRRGFEWLEQLGHEIIEPIPSLFTFNMPNEEIIKLMGVVSTNAQVKIQGSKLKSDGPLLITHWGMSGPAILKLSAFGARELYDKQYNFSIQVNWINIQNHDLVFNELEKIGKENPKKALAKIKPFKLPSRLWNYLIEKTDLNPEKPWGELGRKSFNRLVTNITNDIYQVSGKTTFKEEFVTCGGISLADINFKTMESRKFPNLYFAGEVIDVDGITGGYNFQAAWSTAFVAAKLQSIPN